MEPITLGGGEHSNAGDIQEKTEQPCQICFDLDFCTEPEIGLKVLIGAFQFNYSTIL